MKLRSILALTTALTIAVADPAAADPISGAIAAISTGFSWLAGKTVGAFLLRTAVSFGLSKLASIFSPREGQQTQRGIATETTTTGGTAPQTVIFGRYATGGHLEAPMMTHGVDDDDQEYLTYVISLSDHRITDIPWVIVDERKTRFTAQRAGAGGYYGATANGSKFTDRAWMRWHDGTQTEADPTLVETYGSYERPWTEDHILAGVAYSIMTFAYDSGYKQYPEVRFDVRGAPLYDPRQDSSVGGVGEQRWDDPETWTWTENPVVMVYNLLRGLTLADGSIYGLAVDADDLPLDRWVAAMNTCDEVHGTGLRHEARYTCGIEFSLDTEPLAVIEDILKSCGGQVAECGGIWNIQVGPAPFARAHIVDEDIIVSNPRELTPFRGLADTYNCIHASHPDRHANWVARDAPTYYRDDWIQEDDGRRLVAELALPTVTQYGQVQRLMQELVTDNRLMITHAITLPPTALGLLPLDTLTWTSARNDYQDKLFQIVSKAIDPATLNVKVALRERSPGEYVYAYHASDDLYEDPALPDDGSPDPKENPPEGDYVDPVSGDPIEPVRPGGTLGDVVALHDGAVSRSSDGGANWTRIPATFGMSRQISAIDGQGFLVRTAGSEIAYSAALERWQTLTLEGFSTQPVSIANGNFETGDTSGWTIEYGAPTVLDTTQPPQRGGQFYLSGDPFEVFQSVAFAAAADATVAVSADVYTDRSATAEIEVRVGSAEWEGRNYTLPDVQLSPEDVINANKMSSSLALLTVSGSGVQYLADLIYIDGETSLRRDNERLYFRFSDRSGVGHWRGGVSNSYASNNTPEVIDYPSGGMVVDRTLTLTNPSRPGLEVLVHLPQGWKIPIGYDNFNPGYMELKSKHSTYDTHLVIPPENYTPAGYVQTLEIPGAGRWRNVALDIPASAGSPADIVLRSTSGRVTFDNIRAEIVTPGDTAVRCIARDLAGRRHLAATAPGIHAIVDGQATQLCETPFAAELLAADGDVLVIAAGVDVAISTDDGATWTQHSAGGTVVDLHARPAPVAVLFDGSVLSVDAAGLTETSDLGSAHQLAWDARRQQWLAVSAGGVVQSSPDLATWTQEPDMPAGASGDRRILPLDIGRLLGRAENSKDLFWSDGEWSLAPSLTSRIRDMSEVK